MLAGNLTALFSSCAIMTEVTLSNPNDDYTWKELNAKIHLVEHDQSGLDPGLYDEETLDHAKNWIVKWGVALTLILVVAWPLLAIPAGAFSQSYFVFWVVLTFIWCIAATLIMVLLPLWEDKESIWAITAGMLGLSAAATTTATASPASSFKTKETDDVELLSSHRP
jgi:hypothetical protein